VTLTRRAFLPVLLAAALAGCQSHSPYSYMENWLICEGATRTFAVPADVFYVQGTLYNNVANVPMMYSHARAEVGKGRFSGIARVFSPLVANEEDVALAFKWYLMHFHERKRPFFLIGEGEGGKLLKRYEMANLQCLKVMGLAGSYYTEVGHKGFVTPELVKKIKADLAHLRFRTAWGREMPEGMVHD